MSHLSFETLVDWWTGDLADAEPVELHLMGCSSCAAEAERIGAIVTALRSTIPLVVTAERVEVLRARGLRITENRFAPGVRTTVVFPADRDVLVHHLGGLDLGDAVRVALIAESEAGGPLTHLPDVPFDRERGEVLVACQSHFRDLPHDIVLRVRSDHVDGRQRESVFPLPHVFV